jgi:hypothetical protein
MHVVHPLVNLFLAITLWFALSIAGGLTYVLIRSIFQKEDR